VVLLGFLSDVWDTVKKIAPIAAPFIPGLGAISVLGGGKTALSLGGLLGGLGAMNAGKTASANADYATSIQKRAIKGSLKATDLQYMSLEQQNKALQPMLEMFTKFGAPGYNTALQGLMSSYGYRPAEKGTSGTSVGQAPAPEGGTTTPRTVKDMKPDERVDPSALLNSYTLSGSYTGKFNNAQLNTIIGDYYNWKAKQPTAATFTDEQLLPEYLKTVKDKTKLANRQAVLPGFLTWADTNEPLLADKIKGLQPVDAMNDFLEPGGTWGYYGEQGVANGQAADKYGKARQLIQDRAATEGLSPDVVTAALQRIDIAETEENGRLQIEAQRAGPLALLQALAPALNMGPASASGSAQVASGAAQLGNTNYNMGNTAAMLGQTAANDQGGLATVMQMLGKLAGGVGTTNVGGRGAVAHVVPMTTPQSLGGVNMASGVTPYQLGSYNWGS
jgi:hypothetical protein